jgi:hypothetical protein
MTSSRKPDFKRLVADRVRAAGLDWEYLQKSADQIIVFGSYALGVNTGNSDLDVLCIGEGKRYKSKSLHLVWMPKSRLGSPALSHSELATHVAVCGQWIKGNNTWANSTVPSLATVQLKRKRILNRAAALTRHWNDLLTAYQNRQVQKLRRDVQRYLLLRAGSPSSAKPILDFEWNTARPNTNWSKVLRQAPELRACLQPVVAKLAIRQPKVGARVQ